MTRRPQVLFLAALLGVLVVVGLVVAALAGPWAAAAYAVVVLALLSLGAGRARAAQARARAAAGRTCTCCTTSQHDPVKVI
ncbi:MAG: hypothetical protein LH469_14440 [Frankiaceae bacterium]|nr:hypothetical protein [Frankiaceae bacterium]